MKRSGPPFAREVTHERSYRTFPLFLRHGAIVHLGVRVSGSWFRMGHGVADMKDIVEELRLLQSGAQWACGQTADTLEQAADEIERLTQALEAIADWANAYSEDVFLPIDIAEAREKLGDGTFSCLHAAWARHLTSGIGKIAGTALRRE
jgi:hypothetical protein